MKLSQILYKQHIGRMTRRHWYVHGKKTPHDLRSEKVLTSKGVQIIDSKEILKPKRTEFFDFKKVNFLRKVPIPKDQNHPDWHDRPCLVYEDHELLVQGLAQAQQITKTVVFENVLPANVEALTEQLNLPQETDTLVQRIIENSVIFDAHQELLPKLKDPSRPAWNFPRQMGITDQRKISNLSKKLIQLCDCLSGPQVASTRSIIENALLCYPFEKEFDQLMFTLTMDVVLMSEKPLKPAGQVKKDHDSMTLPILYPMTPTVGMRKQNIYKLQNLYPLISGYHQKNIHTVFIYYDKTSVKNITELETEETQVFGRAMMKAFTAAASTARQKYGTDVKELPEPITVQCIQSDGKQFYFSVYQLNTLDIDGENGMKNYCWTLPKLNLYNVGGYENGKPVVEGYNPEVFRRILAFYKNN
ncbi:mitochondrial ribosomal protein L37 [Nasonia vitripennis]|uniref:Large ribosomal subunit protein mL37 n=1 Tax=Nasonia vitripennis TaxID=7425 RepID=A0A7M6UN81_NASVI|nr:mitochondrial ribosomal protein L37 [Nasonia vitripennis]